MSALSRKDDLREELGYVPQKGVLFSGTIASNILYGNPDGSEAEMKEAAEIAQATEFIEEKHKNTKVRSHRAVPTYPAVRSSVFLSHVRLQNKPKVYIFDDSFSALDYKTDVTLRLCI